MYNYQIEEIIPNKFEFIIGGFVLDNFTVKFKDGGLTYTMYSYEEGIAIPEMGEVIPTTSEWRNFWIKVEELKLWQWKKSYNDPNILDGTQWSLKIKINNRRKYSYGFNRYPDSFENFLKILSELLGGLSIH